jgi:hypothetical protein
MSSKARSLLIFFVLLIPSFTFVWRNRDMPEFGYLHDDGLQYLTAKSVAQGNGYRIQSLPENPAETKFPPLSSLYLSIVWVINPNFPSNLRAASFFCWVTLVLLLGLSWAYYALLEMPAWRVSLLAALLAINPYMILFGVTPFSEVLFTCFVLAALILADLILTKPNEIHWVILAGLVASAAYLTRTAGIVLLIAVPAWLWWWRGQLRNAIAFALAMLPGIVIWTLWTRFSMYKTQDATLIYYIDYLRGHSMSVGLDNLAVVMWKNLDQTLYSIGSLILPKVVDLPVVKILTQVLAVAAIFGIVRMVRKGIMVAYALFALLSAVILLIWHFPPNERLVLPLLPLVAAGLVTELEQLGRNIKGAFAHKDRSQRIVAAAFGGGVAVLLVGMLTLQCFVTFSFLDESAEQKRAKLKDLKQAYTWIAANLPSDARILSYDDPLMFLYTGRRGNYLPLLPRLWYADNHDKMIQAYRDLPAYCRTRGLEYVYFTSDDPDREVGDEDKQKIATAVKTNPELVPLFHAGIGTVYRVASPLQAKRFP